MSEPGPPQWWSKPASGIAAEPTPGFADPPSAAVTGAFHPYGEPVRRRGAGRLVALAAALALLSGLVGGVSGAAIEHRHEQGSFDGSTLSVAPAGTTARPADSVAGVAAAVLPSVVQITEQWAGQEATGSGFVIRSDGYIVTNNHVVAGASDNHGTIVVRFNDGRSLPGTVVGRDASYDLAVVKVSAKNLPALTLGNSDAVVVGDPVVAVGSPLGLAGTVTSGIISAKDRPVTTNEPGSSVQAYSLALQTDAAINPGNSGGPLVDMAGHVIGVNSSIATLGPSDPFGGTQSGSIGLGFAIPINQVRTTANQLIATGQATHPIIGVRLDGTYTGTGARIPTAAASGQPPITPGGPAAKAGLKPGDVIVAIDGQAVSDQIDLIARIRAAQPGQRITLTVERGGQRTDFVLTLGSSTT